MGRRAAQVTLKRQFMDEAQRRHRDGPVPTISGEEWYVQSAMRAVNQAVGRVIRHKDDYGAIIFADQRFADTRLHVRNPPPPPGLEQSWRAELLPYGWLVGVLRALVLPHRPRCTRVLCDGVGAR
jgi:Rad3-related DNA helicase